VLTRVAQNISLHEETWNSERTNAWMNSDHKFKDRAAGWVSYGRKWKTITGRQYLWTLLVYLQPLWRNWPAKQSHSVKKSKIRAITAFKVIRCHSRSSRSVSIESLYATSY